MIGYLNRSDERRACLPFDEGEHLKGGPGFQWVALEIDSYTKNGQFFPIFICKTTPRSSSFTLRVQVTETSLLFEKPHEKVELSYIACWAKLLPVLWSVEWQCRFNWINVSFDVLAFCAMSANTLVPYNAQSKEKEARKLTFSVQCLSHLWLQFNHHLLQREQLAFDNLKFCIQVNGQLWAMIPWIGG